MSFTFDIQQITGGDVDQLDTLFKVAAAPAAPLAMRTNTAEKLSSYLFKGEQLDAALTPQLTLLQKAFVKLATQNDDFYCSAQHPLRKVFECILTRARTWYPRDSKPNQLFYEKITALINAAVDWTENHAKSTEANKLQEILADFNHWADAEDKRAVMLETRLCEAEINNLKVLTAECRALDLINESLSNKEIPNELIHGISTILKNELQHTAFIAGVDSSFWKSWQRLLPMLGYVFSGSNYVDEQQLYRDIPIMLNELERTLKLSTANPDGYREFVEVLSQVLMRSIQKQPQKCQILQALAYPEGHSNLNARITDAVLQQTAKLKQGDWILFSAENDQLIRCKLALKNPETEQLLFVDNTGRKVMIKSSKDFSLCVSTGIAKPLPTIKLDEAVNKIIHALIELSQQKSAQLHAKVAEQKTKAKADAAVQNTEQRISEEEAATRRAAAQKALSEARALATEKARRVAEQNTVADVVGKQPTGQAVEKSAPKASVKSTRTNAELTAPNEQTQAPVADKYQRQLLAITEIGALNVGAWIEIINPEQEPMRCKLAVMIASAGKYIFVDNLGRKVAEYQRDQLIQAYVDGSLTLLNNGDRFEDQLVKVIRGLRKDIS